MKIGFYTGSADHVPNKNVGSSWLHEWEHVNTFLIKFESI